MINGLYVLAFVVLGLGLLLILCERHPRYRCADCATEYSDHESLRLHERIHGRCLCGGDRTTGHPHHPSCLSRFTSRRAS